tara:strand:- start:8382 stop:9431 length:1050 start_codon:yes stop_codon:yes gene_type:complete
MNIAGGRAGYFSRPPFKILFFFSVFGLFYALLSYVNVLPDAWTTLYRRAAIPQQAIFVLAIPVFVLANYTMFQRILESRFGYRYFYALLVSYAGYRAVTYASGQGFDLFFNTLSNSIFPVYVAIGHIVFVRFRRTTRAAATIVGGLMVPFTSFLQNSLGGIYLAAIGFLGFPRMVLYGLVFSLVGVSILGQWYFDAIWKLSPNTGVRLWMMRAGIDGFIQSYGLGVGFGKESLKTIFPLLGRTFLSPTDTSVNFIMVGNHNALVQLLFRMGLIGFLLFLSFLLKCLPSDVANRGLRNSAFYSYGMIFILLLSNPSIESAAYHVGLAVAIAYVLACKSASIAIKRRGAHL